jgi:hypothetical protein
MIVLAFVIIIAIVCVMPSLPRSMHILSLAARPLKNMPSLLLFPLVEILLGACIFVLMIGLCLYAISIGDIDTVDTSVANVSGGEVKEINFSSYSRLLLIFFVPMCFWWLSFLSHVGEFVVSSAGSVWFFSKDKTSLDSPIILSLKNLFKYHMGSLLWACIIIPTMRTFKATTGWFKGQVGS